MNRNWQRKPLAQDKLAIDLIDPKLTESCLTLDKITFSIGDYAYVVGKEFAGTPFFIARIMHFNPQNKTVLLNWIYRSSELSRPKRHNSRQVLLTMHVEELPISHLRTKCTVKYVGHIQDFDKFTASPNCFWFSQMWDRFIGRVYEVVPSESVTNTPPGLSAVIRHMYDFLLAEPAEAKTLAAASKDCGSCGHWCSTEDSVACTRCDTSYHMACTSPPFTEKIQKGYSWYCGYCDETTERLPQKRRRLSPSSEALNQVTTTTQLQCDAAQPADPAVPPSPIPQYIAIEEALQDYTPNPTRKPPSQSKWPFRYMGLNSSLIELFDPHSSLNPRAATRTGPKHQAVVPEWGGRPVEYYRVLEDGPRKRGTRQRRSATELSYTPCDLDISKPWVQEMPQGYIERGGDASSTLVWSNVGDPAELLAKAAPYATQLGMQPYSVNFMDACLRSFLASNAKVSEALRQVSKFTRKSLKEPSFTPEEVHKFEEALAKYGSELHQVFKHVQTKSSAEIVRYYYIWKKTESGKAIWSSCKARTKKFNLSADTKAFMAAIADPNDPLCAYSSQVVEEKEKSFECQFCQTVSSLLWYKAPGTIPLPDESVIGALCARCARIYYRYAEQWYDPKDVLIDANQKNHTIEYELLQDANEIFKELSKAAKRKPSGPRKRKTPKAKVQDEPKPEEDEHTDLDSSGLESETESSRATTPKLVHSSLEAKYADNVSKLFTEQKKNLAEKASVVEEQANYCVVCGQYDPSFKHLTCVSCGLVVHANCYGWQDAPGNWYCDCCSNDNTLTISYFYSCELCPLKLLNYSGWLNGEEAGVDALKRTCNDRWAHVRCGIWIPELKYERPDLLQPLDNFHTLAKERLDRTCFICKASSGVCVKCDVCGIDVHVSCAQTKNFQLGFVLEPHEGVSVTFNGERGVMEPVVRCGEHNTGRRLVAMSTMDESCQLTALEVYARNYKSSATALRGCARVISELPYLEPEREMQGFSLCIPSKSELQVLNSSHSCMRKVLGCRVCNTTSSCFWFEAAKTSVNGFTAVCRHCFFNPQTKQGELSALPNKQSIEQGLSTLLNASICSITPVPVQTPVRNTWPQMATPSPSMQGNFGPQMVPVGSPRSSPMGYPMNPHLPTPIYANGNPQMPQGFTGDQQYLMPGYMRLAAPGYYPHMQPAPDASLPAQDRGTPAPDASGWPRQMQ